jgi:DNA-binding transcriptional MerR regulator
LKLSVPAILLSVALLTGCASFQQDLGDYIKDAVTKSVETTVDKKLTERGLSITEIKSAVDTNKDGKLSGTEIYGAFKDTAKDAAVLEAKKLIDDKIAQLQAQSVSKDQLESKSSQLWYYGLTTILTLLSAYLGKQIRDAKSDTSRDHRIAMLEKALQTDLDGDGKIGDDQKGLKRST